MNCDCQNWLAQEWNCIQLSENIIYQSLSQDAIKSKATERSNQLSELAQKNQTDHKDSRGILSRTKERLNEVRNNITFSLQAKLFVMKLNWRNRIDRFKRAFESRRISLPRCISKITSKSQTRNNNNKVVVSNGKSDAKSDEAISQESLISATGSCSPESARRNRNTQQETQSISSSISSSSRSTSSSSNSSSSPSSSSGQMAGLTKQAFELERNKILSRLEEMIKEKRREERQNEIWERTRKDLRGQHDYVMKQKPTQLSSKMEAVINNAKLCNHHQYHLASSLSSWYSNLWLQGENTVNNILNDINPKCFWSHQVNTKSVHHYDLTSSDSWSSTNSSISEPPNDFIEKKHSNASQMVAKKSHISLESMSTGASVSSEQTTGHYFVNYPRSQKVSIA